MLMPAFVGFSEYSSWYVVFSVTIRGFPFIHHIWNLPPHSVPCSLFPLLTSLIPIASLMGPGRELQLVSMCPIDLCPNQLTCDTRGIILKWKSDQAPDLSETISELNFPEMWHWNHPFTNYHHSLAQIQRNEQNQTKDQEKLLQC